MADKGAILILDPDCDHHTVEQWQRAAEFAQRCADRRRQRNSNVGWIIGGFLLIDLLIATLFLIGFGLVAS